ncbi:MAG: hypothetical protein HS111_11760 [Kofleriaceae bacterium]|nr:hypothetical protein [Kofleriaceae bacterium]
MEVGGDVDPEHPHPQGAGVLDVDLDRDRRAARDPGRVGRREVELDPLAQRGGRGRPQQRGPDLGVGIAGEQPHLGVQAPDPVGLDVLVEGAAVPGAQEVTEVGADQGLVAADRGQAGGAREVVIEGGDLHALQLAQPRRPDVAAAARQGQVGEQARAIERAEGEIAAQAMVEDVRPQRVERRRQPDDHRPQLVEVGHARRGVELPLDVRGRPHADEHRLDPALVLAQRRHQRGQRVELGPGQALVDRDRAEAPGVLLAQLGGDQLEQAGQAGAIEPPQELATEVGVEGLADQPDQPGGAHLVEAAPALEREREEAILGQPAVVEARGVARGGGLDLRLVVELGPGLVAQRVGHPRQLGAGAEEELAPLEPLQRRGVAMARPPARDHRVDLGQLAGVLQVDGAPVVVFLGAGDQAGERGRAIVAERQPLELLDVHVHRA